MAKSISCRVGTLFCIYILYIRPKVIHAIVDAKEGGTRVLRIYIYKYTRRIYIIVRAAVFDPHAMISIRVEIER